MYSIRERIEILNNIKKLQELGVSFKEACNSVHPSQSTIKRWIKQSDNINIRLDNFSPFTNLMNNGEYENSHFFFDLGVLTLYYHDPRYYFEFHDYSGCFYFSEEYITNIDYSEIDDVEIQRFGLGYSKTQGRVIAVRLIYLSRLTPKHQRIWKEYIVKDKCDTTNEYITESILGAFPETGSITQALLEEQKIFNAISEKMGRKPFFRNTYTANRPKELSFILKPTKKYYYDFIHILDKIVNENISKKFFYKPNTKILEISDETVKINKEGKKFTEKIGTLKLLEKWLKTKDFSYTEDFFDKLFKPFNEIRKIRQEPAHEVYKDEYDIKYYKLQNDLLDKIYNSIRILRKIFNDFIATPVEIPPWIDDCRIIKY